MDHRSDTEAPLVPARMLNELIYCPRLFHLEWVQGEFVDNHFTVEGQASTSVSIALNRGDCEAELPECWLRSGPSRPGLQDRGGDCFGIRSSNKALSRGA